VCLIQILQPGCAKNDLTRCSKSSNLLDHLIGEREQGRRHLKAERLPSEWP
jgi:hypothetical protein